MKISYLIEHSIRICFMVILGCSLTIHADKVWRGASTSDVLNENLFITGDTGDVILPLGPRTIRALTSDVTVTLAFDPNVVGNSAGASQLYLETTTNRTITFVMGAAGDQDLTFKGSTNTTKTPLLIIHDGSAGSVRFDMHGGRVLSFTSSTTNGGTQYYEKTGSSVPQTFFDRNNSAGTTNSNITINVGPNSLVSYLSDTVDVSSTASQAAIRFFPQTAGAGRMILDISPTGGVVIQPHLSTNTTFTTITLANIDRTRLAGGKALFEVRNNLMGNTTISSSLLVVNRNTQLFNLLIDPFLDLGARTDGIDYNGTFNGDRFGFVLSANGALQIFQNSYLDYVGTATDQCPTNTVPGFSTMTADELLKLRNPSAFFVDGTQNPNANRAEIVFTTTASAVAGAIFFRSGVDNTGLVANDVNSAFPFTIDPTRETPLPNTCDTASAGFVVFDVEGPVDIYDSTFPAVDSVRSKLEILSLFVTPNSGSLFVGVGPNVFPLRTFATDGLGKLRQYNKSHFLINNEMNLFSTALFHSDVLHDVFQKNDVRTEPTYTGGETWVLTGTTLRPRMAFNNSRFELHSSAALAGVDLSIPETDLPGLPENVCTSNTSKFRFFQNGIRIDKGTGRYLNLGTQVGSTTCDGCTIVSRDAHLDVMQTGSCTNTVGTLTHKLILDVSANDTTITQGISGNISSQFSVHSIFLGHSSNISIGTQESINFLNETSPELNIAGNFFSFESRGGPKLLPELSNVTGVGGIFVDRNGKISIDGDYRASFAATVTKSSNGNIVLPRNQVYFSDLIGIAQWKLDLRLTTTVITSVQTLSDYSLNWLNIEKDYDNFTPYEIDSVNSCTCITVTRANISAIPTVLGEVNQMQLQGSRIGDQAHLLVDSGWVRELTFQRSGNYAAQAPTGVIVLQREGRVGLGAVHRDKDTIEGPLVLGVNGVTIIANGDSQVDLNQDVIINNECPILKGPDFTSGNKLVIHASEPRSIHVTKEGTLDLRSFGTNQKVQFIGNVRVILEAGSKVLLNGVTLSFADACCLVAEPFEKADQIFNLITHGAHSSASSATATTSVSATHNQFAPLSGIALTNTDSFRVRLIGTGTLEYLGESCFFIPINSFVGVETLFDFNGTRTCEISGTNLSIVLKDNAQWVFGDEESAGGSFQVGNVADRSGHSINFTLSMQGLNAKVILNSGAFLGLGVGIADKRFVTPNDWMVDTTFNVSSITIEVIDGLIQHARIFSGDDSNASLIAIGKYTASTPLFNLLLEDIPVDTVTRSVNSTINGGGNIAVIARGGTFGNAGVQHPVITTDNDQIVIDAIGTVHPRMRDGLLTSRFMMLDTDQVNVTPDTMFDFVKMVDFQASGPGLGKGASAIKNLRYAPVGNALRVGYVDRGSIGRDDVYEIADVLRGITADRQKHAAEIGAVSMHVDLTSSAPGRILFAQQLPG